jgi:hypothetical protein
MKKQQIEKDVETTIRMLRFLTGGQGSASVNIFDSGAGGGFSYANVWIDLLRDGKMMKQEVYSLDELKKLLLFVIFENDNDEIKELTKKSYKRLKWNH